MSDSSRVFAVIRCCIVAASLAAGGGAVHAGMPGAVASSRGIAWQPAASDAEIDRAFAAARRSGKPLFLYWGAVWCPPCNQVKATLFSRADFIERSRAFVAVYVDGDRGGAQKVASRFRVQGYPTMILFKPDGTEITRLPGEVDAERYLLALSAALEAQTPVRDLVRRALAGEALQPQHWRLLAFYSWATDQEQVLPEKELPRRLAELAARAPADMPDVRDRLSLRALAAAAERGSGDATLLTPARQTVDRLLRDPAASAAHADLLTTSAGELVTLLAPAGDARRELALRWERALADMVERTPELAKATRIDVEDARVALWKLAAGADSLSQAQRQQVLGVVARVVAATSDRYERQAVVPAAAHVLREAGLIDESDELLKLELPKAVAPYYHMLGLAGNAKKRNDPVTALRWYEQAWRTSEGPATRLQWGAGYVANLIELAPNDVARIEKTARSLVVELAARSETFYERNQRALSRMAARLVQWQGEDAARRRAVAGIRQQLAGTCARLPAKDPGRANCARLFPAG